MIRLKNFLQIKDPNVKSLEKDEIVIFAARSIHLQSRFYTFYIFLQIFVKTSKEQLHLKKRCNFLHPLKNPALSRYSSIRIV